MSEMTPAGEADEHNLLSLPEDLYDDIASRLDDKDLRSLEHASKTLYRLVSTPRRNGPCRHEVNLYRMSPQESRWLQQRVRRYSHILSDLWDSALEGRDGFAVGDNGVVINALPSLLAACAPSAELSLRVDSRQGERFLTMCEADIAPSVEPILSSFWTALKQHLTELTIKIDPETFTPQQFGAFAMLLALQKLEVACARSDWLGCDYGRRIPYLDVLRERAAIKLPHLVVLRLYGLEQGELVLQCPKLAEAAFDDTASLHIEMKDAFLTKLELFRCTGVRLTATSLEKQLQNLETLIVRDCTEVGEQLITYVSQLQHLQRLEYTYIPAACMPRDFPQSLLRLRLCSSDWYLDLPEGLKELHGLVDLTFRSADCDAWEITRPLAELLPMHSLQNLTLGYRTYIDEGVKREWVDTHTPGLMRYMYSSMPVEIQL